MKNVFKTAALFIASLGIGVAAHAVPIAGTSAGIFQNPIGPVGMVTTGTGTGTFTWGTGSPPNSLAFNGASFSGNSGTPFDLGTISYYNGAIIAGTEANSVDLAITISFTNPAGVVQTFTYMLNIINTPNLGDPVGDSDTISFPTTLPTETFNVGGTLYTLALEVGTVSGLGFSSQTTFSVQENASATATLRGLVTVATVVPEPMGLGLLGIGFLGAAALSTRRRKTSQEA